MTTGIEATTRVRSAVIFLVEWGRPLILLAFFSGGLAHGAEAAAGTPPAAKKTVLVLSGERNELPAIPSFESGLRAGLANPAGTVEIFVEHLDFGRFPVRQHGEELARHLAFRYAGRRIDVVVPLTENAFEFALVHRAQLFPGVPMVAAAIERDLLADRRLPAGVVAVAANYDYRRTIELMLALEPDLREVVVVHGTSDFDLRRRSEALRAASGFAPRLSYRELGGVPLPAIEDEVRRLPPTSAVLVVSFVRDVEGKTFVGGDVSGRLAEISPVPVFATFESHLERGALGGAITDFTAIGRATATVVSKILAGGLAPGVHGIDAVASPLRVNWRALQKWRIPEGRVPRDAQVLFRPPTVWEQHRALIVGLSFAFAILGILVAMLVVELSRRRDAEQTLRESEARFRNVADTAPVLIWMSGPDKLCTFFNKGWLEFRGRALEQELGIGWAQGVHPDDLDRCLATYGDAFDARREFAMDYRLRRHDGEYRWVHDDGVPRHSANGKFLGFIGACVDITERREYARQLEQEHAYLRQVIDINPNFIFAKDRAGRFTLVNAAVADAYGTTVEELVGKTDADFNPNRAEVEHFHKLDLEVMDTRQERYIAEEPITDARGNVRWLQTVKRPILDDDGRAVQVLGASTDITQRKAAEAEIQRNRAELAHVTRISTMGELAASLAHELNQPLTAILSNVHAAQRFMNLDPIDLAEVREILRDVAHEGTRASEIIRRMRALVKKGELEVAPVDPGSLIRDVAALVNNDAIMRGVRVALEIAPALPAVRGDRVQLQQVMLNLMLNAFDAMADRTRGERVVTVQAARDGAAGVRFAVRDRGTGLTSDKLDSIFKPFFTTKRNGLGLGLSISRSIIEAHGALLGVESSPGHGATFYFTLPVAEMAETGHAGQPV